MAALSLRANPLIARNPDLLPSPAVSSPADSEVEMDDLKESIRESLVSSAFDGQQKFLPADKLLELTTHEVIETELVEASILSSSEGEGIPPEQPALIDYVHRNARRVFLTLVYIEALKALPALRSDGFTDKDLPIDLVKAEKVPGKKKRRPGGFHWEVGSLIEPTNKLKPHRWPAFANWTNLELELFRDKQWLFLAPVFVKKETLEHEFHQERPMPFICKDPLSEKSGYFSSVCQYQIHPEHQQVVPKDPHMVAAEPLLVAVKEMKQLRGIDINYKREFETLEILKELDNRHIIKPIAAFKRGEGRRYFLFPWANGGNLREFWREADVLKPHAVRPRRDADLVLWVIRQMAGLTGGIHCLYERNGRHGDLKPENILRFRDKDDRGTLLIADMGLAKFHILVTQQRVEQTSTRTGTFRYEPPEADHFTDQPRSRAYDVWSLGCIYLEFIIWLLFYHSGLEDFNRFGDGGFDKYWDRENEPGQVRVNSIVQKCIDRLSGCLKGDTCLKDVLELIRTRMLLVRVKAGDLPKEDARADAEEILLRIEEIRKKAETNANYLFDANIWTPTTRVSQRPRAASLVAPNRPDLPRGPLAPLSPAGPHLEDEGDFKVTVDAAPEETSSTIPSSRRAAEEYNNPQLRKLNDVWESSVDNDFARKLLQTANYSCLFPAVQTQQLCERCKNLDLWEPGLKIADYAPAPLHTGGLCSLCSLFRELASENRSGTQSEIEFSRVDSSFIATPTGDPVLSIYVPGSSVHCPLFAQVGFPMLPEPGGHLQMALLQKWLRHCDENHECKPPGEKDDVNDLPTRLVYVGTFEYPQLQLLDGEARQPGKYVALSHRWGVLDNWDELICTFTENIADFREHIDFDRLPKTFKDAVTVTRGLGIKYLWIDSLCIVQNDPRDWERESERMEDVYSSAYCTIAASSARSAIDGFLRPRKVRDISRCVTLSTEKRGTAYICKAIDNFRQDVEEGELNGRGWVLQERVLSRRIIHFTATQVYWECGKGVHCETLTRLNNSKATVLGDANFPQSALKYFKNGRIECFQMLYEMYSGLAFTEERDRSVAIAGLEKRLTRTFETKGGYGVFESYLQRGLLWQKPDGRTLTRIDYPDDLHVPSWSWMAFSGLIKYMDIPFNTTDWTEDIQSPFKPGTMEWSKRYWEPHEAGAIDLMVLPRKMNFPDKMEMRKRIRFDEANEHVVEGLRCVVIGKQRVDGTLAKLEPTQYVLVIKPTVWDDPAGGYERVGVGYLLPQHIIWSSEPSRWVSVR